MTGDPLPSNDSACLSQMIKIIHRWCAIKRLMFMLAVTSNQMSVEWWKLLRDFCSKFYVLSSGWISKISSHLAKIQPTYTWDVSTVQCSQRTMQSGDWHQQSKMHWMFEAAAFFIFVFSQKWQSNFIHFRFGRGLNKSSFLVPFLFSV